jgi:hypothetical protein
MRTFDIAQIAEMSGLTIPQIEAAISREKLQVQGKGERGRPRPFSAEDAFTFCVISEMRKLGVDWKRIVGSTAFPWPVSEVLDGDQFFLLTPLSDGSLDLNRTTPKKILNVLRKQYKASGAIVIDGGAIARRIEAFARRTKPAPPGDVEWRVA